MSATSENVAVESAETCGCGPSQICVFQMCSTADPSENLRKIEERLCQMKRDYPKIKMAFLPENCVMFGEKRVYELSDRSLSDKSTSSRPLLARLQALAVKYKVWLSIGGMAFKSLESLHGSESKKIENTHVIVDANGTVVSYYVKMHLFDFNSPTQGLSVKESNYAVRGTEVVSCQTPVGNCGLAVCYDVRFPEMFTSLRRNGAQLLLVPAAFTVPTGVAHWHSLLRARAIENQCYVIAAAQCGVHSAARRSTFGHALVVDAFGTVVAQCSPKAANANSDCVAFVTEINLSLLDSVRSAMPISKHECPHLYAPKSVVKSRL